MAMAKPERQLLRVAAVWGTTVLQTRVLAPGDSFRLGDDAQAAFPIPDGVLMSASAAASGTGRLGARSARRARRAAPVARA